MTISAHWISWNVRYRDLAVSNRLRRAIRKLSQYTYITFEGKFAVAVLLPSQSTPATLGPWLHSHAIIHPPLLMLAAKQADTSLCLLREHSLFTLFIGGGGGSNNFVIYVGGGGFFLTHYFCEFMFHESYITRIITAVRAQQKHKGMFLKHGGWRVGLKKFSSAMGGDFFLPIAFVKPPPPTTQ